MKRAKILLTCLFFSFMFGCTEKFGLCKDDELSIPRENYSGSQLKVAGYYFGEPYSDNKVRIYYLYRNGVFFNLNPEPIENAKNGTIRVNIQNSNAKEVKWTWGTFKISGNTIEIERWKANSNGCETTIYEKGEIKNDSTFEIKQREYRDNGKVEKLENPNSIFYFRPLSQKPDSTNKYVQ